MKHLTIVADLFKKKLEYVVAFSSVVFFLLLSLLPQMETFEFGFYDTLLAIKPEVTQRKDVLLLNIDDTAIEEIGAFPWSRDVIGDTLIRLRELGASRVVFDIEYLSPGQSGVNRVYVKNEFPALYSDVHQEILEYLSEFSQAITERNIPAADAVEVGADMAGYIDQRMNELSSSITSNIFRDNDEYFAKALAYFGFAYTTINAAAINIKSESKAAEEFAWENLLFRNVEDPALYINADNALTRRENDQDAGISPAILPLLSASAGAGFPNVIIDTDGVRRRIELLTEHRGRYVGQLVFSPILDILQPEKLIRRSHRLILVNAIDPASLGTAAEKRRDISIPLDKNGRFLINWLKKPFAEPNDPENSSFRSVSIYAVRQADEYEEKLVENLAAILALQIRNASGYLSYHDAAVYLLESYRELDHWKSDLLDRKRTDFDELFAARDVFFDEYGQFLEGGFDTEIYDTIGRIQERTGTDQYTSFLANIKNNFDIYRQELQAYNDQMRQLRESAAGSFCIIGYTGVGTSDLGVNPFHKSYPNVGTHANIYNTIMTGEFITPAPVWMSWLLALLMCYLSALSFRKIQSLTMRIFYGLSATALVMVINVLLFSFFRIYVETFVPLFSVFVTFLLISILRFVFSEQEKSFIRKAFNMYLSSDVVNEIVDNPELLRLGGQEKQITALFTDIKSFSSLSEKVTPENLVQILNKYLTVMSDIVLDQKGTIDKYIGDAIVSFFGAPLDLPDHAARACLAAVRMKQAETRLNEELYKTGEIPMPIYTRIGVNTGSMVVGNMGTDNKMNYTIMGNDVNMAARLEGVNKQYGTWILVSETTWNDTGNQFLGRRLDRVRVVGIDTPVQLYNLLAVRSEADAGMIKMVDDFHVSLDLYLNRQFKEAAKSFGAILTENPEDAASKIFMERCRELAKTGVPENWSDVISMTTK